MSCAITPHFPIIFTIDGVQRPLCLLFSVLIHIAYKKKQVPQRRNPSTPTRTHLVVDGIGGHA